MSWHGHHNGMVSGALKNDFPFIIFENEMFQVSLCAGCNVYEPWAALVVGAGGGFCFLCVHTLMLK